MSNDVSSFKLLEGNTVVLHREPESCLACLSKPYLSEGYADDDDDEVDSGITAGNNVDTLEISFDDGICWDDLDHPLIQALAPGLSRKTKHDEQVSVPLVGVPFDQVITALRIIRAFSNVRHLVDCQTDYLNSDYGPCFIAFDEKTLYQSFGDKLDRWSAGDFASYANSRYYYRSQGVDGWVDKWNQILRDRFERGYINPGWLPDFQHCGGYLKAAYCIPPQMYTRGGKVTGGEYGTYKEEVQQWIDAYKEKYGVHPCLSVDHPLCVIKPLNHVENKV